MKMSSALLEHHPVIGGEEGLALHPVDDQGVDELALGDLELDVGRKRGAPEPHHAGLLYGGDDLVGRRRVERAGCAVLDLLRGARKRLQVHGGHHAARDARRQSNLANHPEAGACIETDMKPSARAIRWPADTSCPSSTTRDRGRAHVLHQRNDQERGEGKLTNREPARLVLRFRRVHPVPERLEPQSLIGRMPATSSVVLLAALDPLLDALFGCGPSAGRGG